jgi:iron complex outermembrane receptor protein
MRKTLIATASLILLPTLSVGVSAQSSDDALVLEEILVTASRRVERLQEVAMSVSAFTGDFLLETGVSDLTALEEYTPNLKITPGPDSRSTSFRIRGIGSVGSNSGIDPSVGIFIDGIYQGRAGMNIGDLVDVERVEILRGPQGSLYGKNTAAGAISVISKRPSTEFESLMEIGYDSNDQAELRGMINIPFGDSGHAMRLSGFGVEGDHLYENTYNGEGLNNTSRWGGRARILLNMEGDASSADFGELVFTLDYTNEDSDCCAFATIEYEGLSPLNSPATNSPTAELQAMLGLNAEGKPILRYTAFEDSEGFSPPKVDPFSDDYWIDVEPFNKVDVGGVSAEWNKDIAGDNTITFINAWRFYDSDSAYDGDFTAYDAARATSEVDLDQYSSELRIASPGGETFDYQAGLYAYYSEFDSVTNTEQREALVDNILIIGDLSLGFFFPDGSVNVDTNLYTTTSYAAFGQGIWNFNEEFSATLGLRYTYEKKEREGSQITTPAFFLDIPPIAGPDYFYDDSRSDSDISPALNLRYFFNPDVMGYVSVSRGFKSGGYDQTRQAAGENGEFDEEIATNYELGWKTSWGNRRLQFNGTLFLVDYEDFQSQSFDGASVRVVNAGDLRSYGTELELIFIPVADVTLGSAIGYNKAEYDSFDNGQCTVDQSFYEFYVVQGAQSGAPGTSSICNQDLAGEPLDNAPEWNVSSYVQYETELGANLMGVARLEHSYTDSFFLDQDLDPNLENDPVNLVNLRLSLSNADRSWEVALWGRNMLDEEYYSVGIDAPTIGGYAGVVAARATYGITLRLIN